MTLSDATTPGQSGPGSKGNKGVLHILQISKADNLMSYPGHRVRGGKSGKCLFYLIEHV